MSTTIHITLKMGPLFYLCVLMSACGEPYVEAAPQPKTILYQPLSGSTNHAGDVFVIGFNHMTRFTDRYGAPRTSELKSLVSLMDERGVKLPFEFNPTSIVEGKYWLYDVIPKTTLTSGHYFFELTNPDQTPAKPARVHVGESEPPTLLYVRVSQVDPTHGRLRMALQISEPMRLTGADLIVFVNGTKRSVEIRPLLFDRRELRHWYTVDFNGEVGTNSISILFDRFGLKSLKSLKKLVMPGAVDETVNAQLTDEDLRFNFTLDPSRRSTVTLVDFAHE